MKKFFGVLQKIGKSLMLPVSVLPAAGILLRLGQPDLLGRYAIFAYLGTAGDAIFSNLPLIFAVGVAIGFSGGEAVAALAAVVGQMILQSILVVGSKNLGIALNMGVFGGILIGIMSAILYNKFHNIKPPQVLGFFGGKRFVPIITSVGALILGIVSILVWPPIGHGIDVFAKWASSSVFGPAFYAAGKRLLIPVGLHHIYYQPFLFQFGSYVSNGIQYFGDSARFFHGDPTAGIFMASEYPILMFGLPGAALAMIAAAKKENRKKVTGMMISAAFVAFLTGITEPIEFSFIFVAPILFVFHVLAAFTSGIVTSLLHIRLGYTFSASFIDYILGFKFAEHPFLVWLVGIAYLALYFVIFYFVIVKFNIKTPGREDTSNVDASLAKLTGGKKAQKVLEAIGGKDNIEVLDACITRLRLTLTNPSLVNKDDLKSLGAAGILEAGNNVQVIFGTEAERIKDNIKSIMNGTLVPEDVTEENEPQTESNLNSNNENNEKTSITVDFLAPIEGNIVSLDEVDDEVFKSRALGDGFAIKPIGNNVYSPVDGEIVVLFPTKHAMAIKSVNGIELLIHVGLETVALNGEGFTSHVQQGDSIKKGDLLLSFDHDVIKEKAKSDITPVVITNMDIIDSMDVKFGEIKAKDSVATIKTK